MQTVNSIHTKAIFWRSKWLVDSYKACASFELVDTYEASASFEPEYCVQNLSSLYARFSYIAHKLVRFRKAAKLIQLM